MNRKKLIITAIVLILVLVIGGLLAYFTDVQTKTNKFKMGGVDIDVEEPNFPGDDDHPVNVVPGKTVAKDPQVVNNGEGTVYAFVEVTIPKETVKIGTQTSASLQPLFTTQYISDSTTTPATYTAGVNPAWVLLSTTQNAAVAADPSATPPVTAKPASTTYVYAYGTKADASAPIVLTPLSNVAGSNKTPAIFDSVTFADVKEDSTTPSANSIQGKDYEVTVTGYGIQTEGLTETDASDIYNLAKNN